MNRMKIVYANEWPKKVNRAQDETLTFCSDRRMVGIKHELNVNVRYNKKRQINTVATIVRWLNDENIVHH